MDLISELPDILDVIIAILPIILLIGGIYFVIELKNIYLPILKRRYEKWHKNIGKKTLKNGD